MGLLTFINDKIPTRCVLTNFKGEFIYELDRIYKTPGYQWDLGIIIHMKWTKIRKQTVLFC